MPSKWGTKFSYRGIGFFCCFFRLHLNSRVGSFWLASLQYKTQQMNEQHKYSLFPLVSGCFVWTVLGCYCSIWSDYCKKITSRNGCGNHCDEIDSVPVHYISKRKKEGAQKRLSVILTRSWCLLSSCWCYPPPFLRLLSLEHLKPESLTPRSGLCHQFHLWSPCFRFQRTGIAVRVRRGPR